MTLCNRWYEIEQDNQGKQKLHVKSRKNTRKAKSGVVGETGRRHGKLTERLNLGLTCRASICLHKTLIRFVSVLWSHINKLIYSCLPFLPDIVIFIAGRNALGAGGLSGPANCSVRFSQQQTTNLCSLMLNERRNLSASVRSPISLGRPLFRLTFLMWFLFKSCKLLDFEHPERPCFANKNDTVEGLKKKITSSQNKDCWRLAKVQCQIKNPAPFCLLKRKKKNLTCL